MDAQAWLLAANFALYALISVVHQQSLRHPRAPWVRWLVMRQFGPRTDTRRMGPADHFRSAAAFLAWFAAFFGLWLLNAYAGPPVAEASAVLLAINFLTAVFGLIWLAGAAWMLVLGTVALVRR